MNPVFAQPLHLTNLGDVIQIAGGEVTRKWEHTYILNNDNFGVVLDWTTIRVPKGSVTDLASVPRYLWYFIAPFGLHERAATIHDHLYRRGALTRREADRAFYECMLLADVPKVRARIMWAAVRLTPFGYLAYNHRLRRANQVEG